MIGESCHDRTLRLLSRSNADPRSAANSSSVTTSAQNKQDSRVRRCPRLQDNPAGSDEGCAADHRVDHSARHQQRTATNAVRWQAGSQLRPRVRQRRGRWSLQSRPRPAPRHPDNQHLVVPTKRNPRPATLQPLRQHERNRSRLEHQRPQALHAADRSGFNCSPRRAVPSDEHPIFHQSTTGSIPLACVASLLDHAPRREHFISRSPGDCPVGYPKTNS